MASFADKKHEGEIRKGHQSYLSSVVKEAQKALEVRKSKTKRKNSRAHPTRHNFFTVFSPVFLMILNPLYPLVRY